jgi:hypothetical protein
VYFLKGRLGTTPVNLLRYKARCVIRSSTPSRAGMEPSSRFVSNARLASCPKTASASGIEPVMLFERKSLCQVMVFEPGVTHATTT